LCFWRRVHAIRFSPDRAHEIRSCASGSSRVPFTD
jgi:hypothetical protein